jgi:hypothetical protein
VWEKLESQWEEMFIALTKYKKKFGDCNVPQQWAVDKQLGKWVGTQRGNYQKRILSKSRIKRLEEIGFVWGQLDLKWEGMFMALTIYKDKHGDCNVPLRWAENKKLGLWVGSQRQFYQKGKLSEDRIKRLEDIGFVWNIRNL